MSENPQEAVSVSERIEMCDVRCGTQNYEEEGFGEAQFQEGKRGSSRRRNKDQVGRK